MNTFGDFTRRGPGLSGSVVITPALGLITRAAELAADTEPPSPEKLPVLPPYPYPIWGLEAAALRIGRNLRVYELSSITKTGDYRVQITTPPQVYHSQKKNEFELMKKRRKREAKGGAREIDTYDAFEDLKDWYQYLGQYTPTVLITAFPEIGQTGGSIAGNILGSIAAGLVGTTYYGQYEMEFKGDLLDLILKIDGVPAKEVRRGVTYSKMDFGDGGFVAGRDLAQFGMFQFLPELFEPRSGEWPDVLIEIISIDKPDEPLRIPVPQGTVERIWLDFEAVREQLFADDEELHVQ